MNTFGHLVYYKEVLFRVFLKNVSGTPSRQDKYVIEAINRHATYASRFFILDWWRDFKFQRKLVHDRREIQVSAHDFLKVLLEDFLHWGLHL